MESATSPTPPSTGLSGIQSSTLKRIGVIDPEGSLFHCLNASWMKYDGFHVDLAMMVKLKISNALESYNKAFGLQIDSLKQLQTEAIMAVTSGKDCICSLPTGYGKSLTYELLPFMEPECLVIVIVPLNAIIDQQLKKLGDMAMRLKSDLTPIKSGQIKYIFSHPEDILNNKNFNDYFSSESFRKRNINVYLVVDEAHCILEWGEDFRPEFKKLAQIRSVLKCQTIALSATVTEHGQRTISDNLLMTTFSSVCASPAKENISLIVLSRPSPNAKGNCAETPYTYIISPILEELIKEQEQFPITIIYCKSLQWIGYGYQLARQKLGSYFYAGESRELQNARVVMFHSSMEKDSGTLKDAILSSLQKPVAECPIRLIFSTVALGMGADLKHVQRVIHAGPPTSLETYVQEIGRAGRTGTDAQAILYFNRGDLASVTMRKDMKEYCTNNSKCKREIINTFFGFHTTVKPLKCCSVCNSDLGLNWQFGNLNVD